MKNIRLASIQKFARSVCDETKILTIYSAQIIKNVKSVFYFTSIKSMVIVEPQIVSSTMNIIVMLLCVGGIIRFF